MADDISVLDAASATRVVAADEVSARLYQIIKLALGADGAATFLSGGAGAVDAGTLRATLASDDPLVTRWDAGGKTVTTSYTRPADTTAYAANDSLANSTSAPLPLTFDDAARASGGKGYVTDLVVISSVDQATPLEGILYLFDSSPTATNDNAAFALSDTDSLKLVGAISFSLASTSGAAGSGNNAAAHVQGLNIGYECVGDDKLFGLVKVTSAYTPVSGEVLTFRLKCNRNS